ncbi:MAG: YajD family HNH nuclease [Thermodesulfobacteriota bacterium]|nr:YajD family HNH nuclease [Thermodesulfobacteriota bacterium]
MSTKKRALESNKQDQIIAEARRERERRQKTYRERALKILPWICARCGREFTGKRLRELTVHHKDHNHDNNPADGSNWELLCLYCHENEHTRHLDAEWYDGPTPGGREGPSSTYSPFSNLASLLKDKNLKDKK